MRKHVIRHSSPDQTRGRLFVFRYSLVETLHLYPYSLALICAFCLSAFCPATGFSQKPVDLVYPQLDAANSRWIFFSSASRPFGMVNLSPDTELNGAWGSGYVYGTDEIKGWR